MRARSSNIWPFEESSRTDLVSTTSPRLVSSVLRAAARVCFTDHQAEIGTRILAYLEADRVLRRRKSRSLHFDHIFSRAQDRGSRIDQHDLLLPCVARRCRRFEREPPPVQRFWPRVSNGSDDSCQIALCIEQPRERIQAANEKCALIIRNKTLDIRIGDP